MGGTSLGMMISAGAVGRWLKVERALRQSAPLPLPLLVPVLSVFGVLVFAVLLLCVLAP
ncbi:hypothetical protein GXW84_42855 [Rhodococcus sp. IEGM 248]|nr:hypothetical protein [Rhodococcus sp. IEGM 248]